VQADEYHFGRGARKQQSFFEGFDKEAFERIAELK
jgi:hypothetical protein